MIQSDAPGFAIPGTATAVNLEHQQLFRHRMSYTFFGTHAGVVAIGGDIELAGAENFVFFVVAKADIIAVTLAVCTEK